MLNRLLLITIFLLISHACQAQPLFKGLDSESSIKLSDNSAGSINTKDKSITLNFTHYQKNANAFERLSLQIKAKGNNNIGSILTKGDVSPETSLKLAIANNLSKDKTSERNDVIKTIIAQIPANNRKTGFFPTLINAYNKSQKSPDVLTQMYVEIMQMPVTSQADTAGMETFLNEQLDANFDKLKHIKYISSGLWFVLDGGFTVGQYKLLDVNKPFTDQVTNKTTTGWEGKIGFNGWKANSKTFKSRILYGVTIGFKQTNNISKLKQKTIEEIQTQQDTTSARIVKTSTTAYEGSFEESNTIPLNIDWVLAPNRSPNLAIDFYSRINLKKSKNDEWKTSFGVGLFLLKDGNPLQQTGGITFEIDDAFDADDTGKSFKDKFKINVLVGFALPFSGS